MNRDNVIEFRCVKEECKEILSFPMLTVDKDTSVTCPGCGREYGFEKELIRKFTKFATLVNAVKDAEEILGQINVGLDIQGHSIKVPYRLLLTRLNTFLTLDIGGRGVNFRLRVEPLQTKDDSA